MSNLQVRLGDDDTEDLDELARELGLTRSEVARRALAEGMKRLRMTVPDLRMKTPVPAAAVRATPDTAPVSRSLRR